MEIHVRNPNVSPEEIRKTKEEVNRVIKSDPFLRERIDTNELILGFQKDSKLENTRFAGVVDFKPSKTEKRLLVVLSASGDIGDSLYELTRELYFLPGEERFRRALPSISKQLNPWRKKLNDDEFFGIYTQYHSTIVNNGIVFGVLLNNPQFAKEITEVYMKLFRRLYFQRLSKASGYYLFHYGNGLPMTVWSSFLLAGKYRKGGRISYMGSLLEVEFRVLYGISRSLVTKKLQKLADLIVEREPFAEDFFPLTEGEVNYVTLADYVFNDYCDLKKTLKLGPSQLHSNKQLLGYFRKYGITESLFRASLRDRKYID